MKRSKHWPKISACALALAFSGAVSAEPFGLFNGRTANISRSPHMSVELGLQFGDLSDLNYEHLGTRFNYKFNPLTTIYGDLGQSTLESGSTDLDGLSYGLGFFRQIPGIFSRSDFAVHASIHLADLEGGRQDLEGNTILVEGVFSGTNAINDAGTIYFNASIGLARSSFSSNGGGSENDTEVTYSGGIVVDANSRAGQFFAGLLYLEDFSVGAGYRHFLK